MGRFPLCLKVIFQMIRRRLSLKFPAGSLLLKYSFVLCDGHMTDRRYDVTVSKTAKRKRGRSGNLWRRRDNHISFCVTWTQNGFLCWKVEHFHQSALGSLDLVTQSASWNFVTPKARGISCCVFFGTKSGQVWTRLWRKDFSRQKQNAGRRQNGEQDN